MRAKEFIVENETYKGEHEAPDSGNGAPMHDLTGIYPADFYGPNGFRYYADQGNSYDYNSYAKVINVRNNPNSLVKVYRAIPIPVYKQALKAIEPLSEMIRPGDWVSISRDYANEHGQNNLLGKYKIAAMRVRAKYLYTDGNSINEWGYDPQ